MALSVMVIGGGIGGLCLAQGLRKHGVDVAVYERGPRDDDARWQQGFQIHIGPPGAQALQHCLSSSRWESLLAQACRPSDGVQVFNHRMKRVALMESGVMEGGSHVPVVRSTLRRSLLDGLDDRVHFGKALIHFDRKGDDVRAVFDDGTSATANVLVGADGIGSRVRRQLLPHARVEDTGVVGASCKLPLNALPEVLRARLSSIVGPAGRYMIVTQSIHRDGYRANDHGIWVFTCPRAAYGGAEPRAMTGEAIRARVLGLMEGWAPDLRDMVAHPAGRISAVPLLSALPVDRWTPGPVTLLGDAIHAMPPFGGQGGTSALRDAALLCDQLVATDAGRKPLAEAIGDYEEQMRYHGFRAVRSSARFGAMVASPHRWRSVLFFLLMRAMRLVPGLSRVMVRRRFSR